MPLRVTRRKDTGSLTIVGTIGGQSIRRRAASDSPALAREEAAALEAETLRTQWHGERRGSRGFAEAVNSYIAAQPRSASTLARLHRILRALGNVPLSAVDQEAVARVARTILQDGAMPSTVRRGVIVPIKAVLNHAADRGWCDAPRFKSPQQPAGRTRFLVPDEVERLIAASAPHIRPLVIFLVGTGARMSEALELEWRDVDLVGGRAIFWRTKNGHRRVSVLPPVAVLQLSRLPDRAGRVFRLRNGAAFVDADRQYGGQIKTAWRGALRRSGLDADLTPHDLRHTWASWQLAIDKSALAMVKLREAGGWSSVALVERYAHLMPEGQQEAIRRFLGIAEQQERVSA